MQGEIRNLRQNVIIVSLTIIIAAARKSTIIAIASIGFFYVLTLFMGIGAMTHGVANVADNNMSAPLLARSFGAFLFSVISALAFATVLGTVSGLIIAACGAVAHDLMDRYMDMNLSEKSKVAAGKISAFVVGIIAIILGIMFQGMNVSFIVGWAFSVRRVFVNLFTTIFSAVAVK